MIALGGCDISHPAGFDGGVEIVRAPLAPRSFPTRVSMALGLCFKDGPPHHVRCYGRDITYPRDAVCIRLPGCVWSSELSASTPDIAMLSQGGDRCANDECRGEPC